MYIKILQNFVLNIQKLVVDMIYYICCVVNWFIWDNFICKFCSSEDYFICLVHTDNCLPFIYSFYLATLIKMSVEF